MADYYSILGVSKTAKQDEIKKAYRSLAKKHHPDLVQDAKQKEEAKKKFQEVQEAYDVLGDEKKRQNYDALGHERFQNGYSGGQGGFDFNGADFGGFENVFNEFFSQFGGGGFGFGSSAAEYSNAVRGEDLRYFVELTLEQAFKGTKMNIQLPRMSACETCAGAGVDKDSKPVTCSTCKGSGRIVSQQMFLNIQQTCPTCHGKGKSQAVCKSCKGACRVNKKSLVEVNIPAGVQSDMHLRLSRQGNAGLHGGPAGDLFVILRVQKHALFEVEGNNLVCKVPISVPMAVLGGEIEAPTIDGKAVSVKVPSGSQFNTRIKIAGKGMPVLNKNTRGDMYIQLEIDIPTSLGAKEKDAWNVLMKESANPKSAGFFAKVKEFLSGK